MIFRTVLKWHKNFRGWNFCLSGTLLGSTYFRDDRERKQGKKKKEKKSERKVSAFIKNATSKSELPNELQSELTLHPSIVRNLTRSPYNAKMIINILALTPAAREQTGIKI